MMPRLSNKYPPHTTAVTHFIYGRVLFSRLLDAFPVCRAVKQLEREQYLKEFWPL